MWRKIGNFTEIEYLSNIFGGFHDCILREAYIWGGSYVNEELEIVFPDGPVDKKVSVILQRQNKNPMIVELCFSGVAEFSLISCSGDGYGVIGGGGVMLHEMGVSFSSAEGGLRIVSKDLKWREVDCSKSRSYVLGVPRVDESK